MLVNKGVRLWCLVDCSYTFHPFHTFQQSIYRVSTEVCTLDWFWLWPRTGIMLLRCRCEILVLSCTVSDILQVFVLMTSPLFYRNFGGVYVAPDRPCWGQPEHYPEANWPWSYFQSIPTHAIAPHHLNVTDGQTDGHRQADDILWQNRALRSIAM